MRALLIAAAALSGVAAPAAAADVQIRNAVARVIVIVEDRADIGVETTQGPSRLPPLRVRRSGGDVRIDGGLRPDAIRSCAAGPASARQPGAGAGVQVRDLGRIRMEDAPMIVLRTPRDVALTAGGAVFGAVGRGARSVDLGSAGCGDWTVADVEGPLNIQVGGSGGVRAGTSRALDAQIGGSGSVSAGATGDLDAAVGGSGSMTIASVQGDGDISIGGSGDVAVRTGRLDRLSVAIGGSGDVRYGGATRDLDVAIAGSGDVQVASATGSVSRTVIGSGSVTVGP